MQFKISKELILQIEELILSKKDQQLEALLNDMHHADIAEILDELDFDEATYIFKILDSEKTAEILLELEDDLRENILSRLSPKEIAEELDELDTDDAADIIAELSTDIKNEVISELIDVEHAKDIVDLLRYDEDTAGGLMGKELVKVNENWNVLTCVKEMRIQAENVSRVHSIYVVDDENRLKGRLSLKDLLTTSTKTPISEVYIPKVDYVRVDTEDVEVARIMQKYDLEAIPVVDELGRLVGRITIDDIVDVIKDEADKDYQLAAGISQDVEADDSILELTKARLPWLVLALLGGFVSVRVLGLFEGAMTDHGNLFFFTPLIAAMAGNVGVQSSAIIVQGLSLIHIFDKVEIVRVEHPEKSYEALEGMVEHVRTILNELKLPYRILRLCGGDMGFASAMTYDFEVFSTAQDRWLEISSVSNFETFQSHRLKLRYKDKDGKNQLAHTLNGSSLALPRVLAGILENYQTPEGIVIPEVLRPYTGFDIIN